MNANALTIEEVIETVVGEDVNNGGWGLNSSEVNISGLDDKISKAGSKEPQLTFEFIDDFLSELGLSGNEGIIGYYWDSKNRTFNVSQISQATTASNTYKQALVVEKSSVMDEIYSGIIVNYELPTVLNYTTLFFWAPDNNVYDNTSGTLNGVQPLRMMVLPQEGGGDPWKKFVFSTTDPEANHVLVPTGLIADNQNTTGFGLEYGLVPGSTAPQNTYTYFVWFDEPGYYSGVACGTKNIDHIKAVIDIRMRTSDSTYTGDFSLDIEVVGFTAFISPDLNNDTSTDVAPIPDMNTEVSIPGMRYRLVGDSDTSGVKEIVLEVEDLNMDLAAICVKYNACPLDAINVHVSNTFSRLKELVVEEGRTRSEFVRIVDKTGDGNSRTLYAPESYSRLVSDTYKIKEIDAGVVTQGAAISIGRAALIQALVIEDSREFVIQLEERDNLPELLSTVRILNSNIDYSGVVLSREYRLEQGVESVVLLLKDFSTSVIA